jgi:hypothetical protein
MVLCWRILYSGAPVIREELIDLLCGMRQDAAQHILQVLLGIDSQVPAGLHQRQNGVGGAAAVLDADKEPVLAADSQGAQAAFGDVVVETRIRVVDVVR